MDLDNLEETLASWAASKPLVARAWLFGSRVREDHRTDSDLDVALELDLTASGGADDSGGFATWTFWTDGWREELQEATDLTVDLQQFVPGKTPTIAGGLKQSSRLVYTKTER